MDDDGLRQDLKPRRRQRVLPFSVQVEALYDASKATPRGSRGIGDRKLRAEMPRRMLGNGYCARPVGLGCQFESICESRVYFRPRTSSAPRSAPTRRCRGEGPARPPEDLRWAARAPRRPKAKPHDNISSRAPVRGSGQPGSRLEPPYLIELPPADGELVLKARDSWPRTAKVYCHRAEEGWPEHAEIIEQSRSAPASAAGWRSTWCSTGRARTSQLVFARDPRRPGGHLLAVRTHDPPSRAGDPCPTTPGLGARPPHRPD